MIKLDDHRKAILEMMFAKATDKEMIHELVRRDRLRQIQASVCFWPEMRDVDNGAYMEGITNLVLHTVAKTLDIDGCVFKSERPDSTLWNTGGDPLAKRMILTADAIVLRARDKSGE